MVCLRRAAQARSRRWISSGTPLTCRFAIA
jgi:hypothetical protein